MTEFNLENKASSIIASHITKVMAAQNKELNSLVAMFFQKNPEADPSLLKIIQQNKHDGVEFNLAYDFESHKTKSVDVAAVREAGFREGIEAAAKITDEFKANNIGFNSPEAMACFTVSKEMGQYIRALSPAEPVGQWQDIATAPKHGKAVIVYDNFLGSKDGRGQVIARFDKEHGWHVAASVVGGIYIQLTNPIKWTPLPAAPALKGQQHDK